MLKVGDLEINTADLTVRRKGTVTLTAMEYPRAGISGAPAAAPWSQDRVAGASLRLQLGTFSNVIEVYISGLRRKLENGDGTS